MAVTVCITQYSYQILGEVVLLHKYFEPLCHKLFCNSDVLIL